MTFNKNPNQAPVVYLASNKLSVNLPKVSKNTTRLTLSIFTSGNAADEFWYTNVVDKYKDIFADRGNPFIGKGPVRVVNVYFNGEKIAAQTPEPVIFTGGISPALWSPVVSFNAFDVPSIDVDVSGLLPYLWEHQAIEDKILEIEVSNGLGEIDKDTTTSVNENWVTSANLLTYQNDQVIDATGEVINIDNESSGVVLTVAPPYTRSLQQIIDASFSAQLISQFSLTLKNNRTLNTTISSYSKAEVSNVQSYSRSGDIQSIVHAGRSSRSVLIQDNDSPESKDVTENKSKHHKSEIPENTISIVNITLNYPLVLHLQQISKDIGSGDDFFVDYDVRLAHSKSTDITFGAIHGGIHTTTSQNGTSRFFLSSKGNHGFGSTFSKYKSKIKFGPHQRKYKRVVNAVNGTIVLDKSKSGKDDEHGKTHLSSMMKAMEKTSVYKNASEMLQSIVNASKASFKEFLGAKPGCHGMKHHENEDGHKKMKHKMRKHLSDAH